MLIDKHPIIFFCMVFVSVLFAMLFAIVPLRPEYQMLRPELVCLVVIYWVVCVPQHLGVSFAAIIGLFQGLLEQLVFGAHTLALAIVAYIVVISYQRIKNYSLWHQTFWVSILIGLHQIIVNWLYSLMGYGEVLTPLLLSTLISTLCWPVLMLGMQFIRLRYRLV